MDFQNNVFHDLKERIKELTALHETSRILQNYKAPQDNLMNEIVNLFPQAWQYPELTCAKIRYKEMDFATNNFVSTKWRQNISLLTGSGNKVEVEVCYLEERPFLPEEINLINSLSEMICTYFSRKEADAELEKRVTERTVQIRALTSELSIAEERQRRSIASDLHDHVGQTLAMVKFKLQELQGNNIFGPFYEAIGEINTLIEQTISYTRSLTVELSPPVLYELGFDASIEWLAGQTKKKHGGLKIIVKSDKAPKPLSDDLKIALFRSVNELIQNVIKHADATHVIIGIKRERDKIVIIINDNGRGFDTERVAQSANKAFGLFSIKERLSYLGGTLKIESRDGAGTRVIITADLL